MKRQRPKPTIDDIDFVAEFQKASRHVEDILYGRKTIGEITKIPEADVEKTMARARNALKLEDYQQAARLFQAVLVINNRDQRALMGLAGALEGLKQYVLAVSAYMIVMMANFLDPVAPCRAGVCLMNIGKKEEAMKMFKLAADCREETRSREKLKYVVKAENMLKAASMT